LAVASVDFKVNKWFKEVVMKNPLPANGIEKTLAESGDQS